MALPEPIITVLSEFESAFSKPTWKKAQVLLEGALLAQDERTVAAVLREMGLEDNPNFSKYHQFLNRNKWSALELSKRLLKLLVTSFHKVGATLELVIDETLERRWGPEITKRGHWRDSLLSSKTVSVSNSGLRWIVLSLVVELPWTSRRWALPFISVLTTTPKVSLELEVRHKTTVDWSKQLVKLVRRWQPELPLKLIGDGAYSVVELGLACRVAQVTLIAPLRKDARLFAPAPPPEAGKRGRKRLKGAALPKLSAVLADPQTVWQTSQISWYDGSQVEIEWCSGTALWYRGGLAPLPIRWVLTCDPAGKRDPRAYFSTDQLQLPLAILADFIKRWCIEVTFEESRRHLGIETQRQWSDPAIARTTPLLFGMYSLIALLGRTLTQEHEVKLKATGSAWYSKTEPTLLDVLALIRRTLWGNFNYDTSPTQPDLLLIPRQDLNRLARAVCY
jgi:hypothetical protein